MKRTLVGWLVVTALAARVLGQGTILWDETVNGPLSNDPQNPTVLLLTSAGKNSLLGVTTIEPIGNNYAIYGDYFVLTVPPNSSINAISIQVDRPFVATWLGNQTYSTEQAFVGNPSTGDLLDQWGLISIGSGGYGVYLANHDAGPVISIANYRLDFVVEPIPEPASLWLLLGGLASLAFHRWRKT